MSAPYYPALPNDNLNNTGVTPFCTFVHKWSNGPSCSEGPDDERRSVSRPRPHRLPDRQPQALLPHGGRPGATGDARRPGPRRLHPVARRLEPDPETLWAEARPLAHREGGVLVLDDSTLDKPYATKMESVTRHWSGKH